VTKILLKEGKINLYLGGSSTLSLQIWHKWNAMAKVFKCSRTRQGTQNSDMKFGNVI